MQRQKSLLETLRQCTPKAFIFDMDGLIFDTERLFMKKLQEVSAKQGYCLTQEMYVETLGLCGDALAGKMAAFFGEDYPFLENGREVSQKLLEIAETKGLLPKEEIKEGLSYIQSRGIPCAVASSTEGKTVRRFLECAGLLPYFQVVLGGEAAARSKPAPDIFLAACRSLKVMPQETVVLEDSENGVLAADRAGCRIICIPDLKKPAPDILALADYVIFREE